MSPTCRLVFSVRHETLWINDFFALATALAIVVTIGFCCCCRLSFLALQAAKLFLAYFPQFFNLIYLILFLSHFPALRKLRCNAKWKICSANLSVEKTSVAKESVWQAATHCIITKLALSVWEAARSGGHLSVFNTWRAKGKSTN